MAEGSTESPFNRAQRLQEVDDRSRQAYNEVKIDPAVVSFTAAIRRPELNQPPPDLVLVRLLPNEEASNPQIALERRLKIALSEMISRQTAAERRDSLHSLGIGFGLSGKLDREGAPHGVASHVVTVTRNHGFPDVLIFIGAMNNINPTIFDGFQNNAGTPLSNLVAKANLIFQSRLSAQA